MKIGPTVITASLATLIVAGGIVVHPIVLKAHIPLGIYLGDQNVSGISFEDLDGVLQQYESELKEETATLSLRDQTATPTLEEIGVSLDIAKTREDIITKSHSLLTRQTNVRPELHIDDIKLRQYIEEEFTTVITPPKNASLILTPTNSFVLDPGTSGEGVDTISLKRHVIDNILASNAKQPIQLAIVSTAPSVTDQEVDQAKQVAQDLLTNGLTLKFEDQEYEMKNFTLRRLITFIEQVDPQDPQNHILGVQLDPEGVSEYLDSTIAPEINQEAINARFQIGSDGKATQFALPQTGYKLNTPSTASRIAQAVKSGTNTTDLDVTTTEPEINQEEDLEDLGIKDLIAVGESNFSGSPANRIHNIRVGASRYNGLLIPPDTEFSFNQYLGPVTGAAGFKPELVIKANGTIPEFGGGLCQVSTTAFRAAIYSGLKVTERRNHSYAVSYYGTPGFDSTIYPGYTDLRFLNNTPGYILIQTKIVGTKLIFEFWGTDDGRQVEVDGPSPYNRQPNGAVRATLTQNVTKDGEPVIEETFYSNYKSPELFPKTVAANGEPTPTPSSEPDTTNDNSQPKPTSTPEAPSPTPS